MKLGIIGLPQSGKTTIFNALTRGNTPTTSSAGRWKSTRRWWTCRTPGRPAFSDVQTQEDDLRQGDLHRHRGLEGGGKATISGHLLNH